MKKKNERTKKVSTHKFLLLKEKYRATTSTTTQGDGEASEEGNKDYLLRFDTDYNAQSLNVVNFYFQSLLSLNS